MFKLILFDVDPPSRDDTLDSILKMYNVELEDLMEANSQNKIMIRPGSIVVVPAKEKDNDYKSL